MQSTAVRPVTRAYRTTVARVARLSPHFLRLTVTGEELEHFGPPGTAESPACWDQRIKVYLPRGDGTYPEIGLFDDPPAPMTHWYNLWRQLDDAERNPIRTYTVREVRSEAREVDIDFVVHVEADGSCGPAAAFAQAARPGDELVVIGPDRRAEGPGGGIDFTPGSARDLLLAGDETAVPAICGILESLPEHYHGEAYLEVPTAEDVMDVVSRSSVRIHWLPRDGAALGVPLGVAVGDWGERRARIFEARRAAWRPGQGSVGALTGPPQELPEVDEESILWETSTPEGFTEYAWLAGEAGVITGLRRHLVQQVGLSRKQVSFMGYWRQGRPGA